MSETLKVQSLPQVSSNSNKIKLNLIAAVEKNMGIGKNNVLPWNLPNEFEYFLNMTVRPRPDKEGITRQNVVIIGRKTWQTMDQLTFKPFPNAINIVLSKNIEIEKEIVKFNNTIRCSSLEDAIYKIVPIIDKIDQVWVFGGAEVYKTAIKTQYFYRLYLSYIYDTFECDSCFPDEIRLNKDFKLLKYEEINDKRVLKGIQIDNATGIHFEIKVYEKI